jgi:hypothetical protein
MPSETDNARHAAGSAIAAFMLAQLAFGVLVKNGLILKAEAEKMLRDAIEANRTGGPGNQAAAEMLSIVLQSVSAFQPATRQ